MYRRRRRSCRSSRASAWPYLPRLRPVDVLAGVIGIEARELGEDLLRLLADDRREHELDLDELVAARVAAERRHAALAQPELLPRLRRRRDAHHGLAVDRRHLDLRAERGLGHRHGHRAVEVVALAGEERMVADPRDDVEVARRAAALADVAL